VGYEGTFSGSLDCSLGSMPGLAEPFVFCARRAKCQGCHGGQWQLRCEVYAAVQVSAAQAGNESHTLEVLEATQPLIRQVELMRQQLARAAEGHASKVATLQEEIDKAHEALRTATEKASNLRKAVVAAQQEAGESRQEGIQLRHLLEKRDAEVRRLHESCKICKDEQEALAAELRGMEGARTSEIEVCYWALWTKCGQNSDKM
jgi:hypothetical protein